MAVLLQLQQTFENSRKNTRSSKQMFENSKQTTRFSNTSCKLHRLDGGIFTTYTVKCNKICHLNTKLKRDIINSNFYFFITIQNAFLFVDSNSSNLGSQSETRHMFTWKKNYLAMTDIITFQNTDSSS